MAALFRHLGDVEEESNGNLKVRRNGETPVIPPPRSKDVAETDELLAFRHFLERSQKVPVVPDEKAEHWLLVIDHHEARLFRSEMHGSAPPRITPMNRGDIFATTRTP